MKKEGEKSGLLPEYAIPEIKIIKGTSNVRIWNIVSGGDMWARTMRVSPMKRIRSIVGEREIMLCL